MKKVKKVILSLLFFSCFVWIHQAAASPHEEIDDAGDLVQRPVSLIYESRKANHRRIATQIGILCLGGICSTIAFKCYEDDRPLLMWGGYSLGVIFNVTGLTNRYFKEIPSSSIV
ncbi:MAG TPA: hypothetical protein DEZ09_04245 [Holosporales bacterium]|nr:MAG: hypothetical protein A2065_02345 [Alphaproteobacteria bacterium GWB1_45_5]HCI49027.1 hypothetical protein [Holosporales bacterium]